MAAMSEAVARAPMSSLTLDQGTATASAFWTPDYHPETIMPPDSAETDINVLTVRSTGISTAMIMKDQPMVRKTKIVCTMGPKCWDEETMAELIDAGMNVARFNFSHGDHEAHQGVLDRFRKVCKEKKSDCAVLLDTKGPEVRTAMLRNHEPIQLEKDQEIIVTPPVLTSIPPSRGTKRTRRPRSGARTPSCASPCSPETSFSLPTARW